MNNIKRNIEIVNELIEVQKKHKDILHGTDATQLYVLEGCLHYLKVQELFGIDMGIASHNSYYISIEDYKPWDRAFIFFGSVSGCEIAWPDDGKQPSEEWLYKIGFPTGAYFFHDTYPTELFNEFFEELCRYDPKYKDTNNRALYFCTKKAKYIHKDFQGIVENYMSVVPKIVKAAQVQELEDKLKKLKEST